MIAAQSGSMLSVVSTGFNSKWEDLFSLKVATLPDRCVRSFVTVSGERKEGEAVHLTATFCLSSCLLMIITTIILKDPGQSRFPVSEHAAHKLPRDKSEGPKKNKKTAAAAWI